MYVYKRVKQSTSRKGMTMQFQLINYHLRTDLYFMITDKNDCYNDNSLVQSRQRSRVDMAE